MEPVNVNGYDNRRGEVFWDTSVDWKFTGLLDFLGVENITSLDTVIQGIL